MPRKLGFVLGIMGGKSSFELKSTLALVLVNAFANVTEDRAHTTSYQLKYVILEGVGRGEKKQGNAVSNMMPLHRFCYSFGGEKAPSLSHGESVY